LAENVFVFSWHEGSGKVQSPIIQAEQKQLIVCWAEVDAAGVRTWHGPWLEQLAKGRPFVGGRSTIDAKTVWLLASIIAKGLERAGTMGRPGTRDYSMTTRIGIIALACSKPPEVGRVGRSLAGVEEV